MVQVTLDNFEENYTEHGDGFAVLQIGEETQVIINGSEQTRDIRIADGEDIYKFMLGEDGGIRRVLKNDLDIDTDRKAENKDLLSGIE